MTQILSVQQVAEQLGRPRRTVVRWIASGILPATKLGDGKTSAYIVTSDALERFQRGDLPLPERAKQ